MENIDIFEYAAKNKLRFAYKGLLSVEDLYDLSVNSLDEIYGDLMEKKSNHRSSLLNKSTTDLSLDVSLEIVSYIVARKLHEIKEKETIMAKKQKLNHLLAIKEKKEMEELEGMSIDELDSLIKECL